jgi:hypothetical protein
MKPLFTTIFVFLFVSSFGQTQNTVEQKLLGRFERILYWSDFQGDNKNISVYDSLFHANDQFEKTLLNLTSKDPLTISFDFKKLKDQGLSISTSDDGLFRIYSWDTWTGGTMHFQQNIFQYKSGDKVFSKIIQDSLSEEDHYSVNWYIKIFTIKTSIQTFYLGLYDCTYSTKDAYQGVKVFTIKDTILNDSFKLIRTGSGIKNNLGFYYNFFSVVDRKERPIIMISYDKETKTLKIPVVLEEGKVTNRFIIYKFTGRYFERKT